MPAFLHASLRRCALTALLLCPLLAAAADFTFNPYPTPRPLPPLRFVDAAGHPHSLSEYKGRVVLLNVWATWCPPCVQEMPTLNHLQGEIGGADFVVLALSVDKGGPFAVQSFYQENFIDQLAVSVDPSTRALDTLRVLGTPTTILVDRQGREVARTLGPQNWDTPALRAQLQQLMHAPS